MKLGSLSVLAFAAALGSTQAAHAFNESACTTQLTFPAAINVDDQDDQLPTQDDASPSNYSNNTKYRWRFLTNSFVTEIQLRTSDMIVEQSYDKFYVGPHAPSDAFPGSGTTISSGTTFFSGTYADGNWYSYATPTRMGLDLMWSTDSSVTKASSPGFDQVRVRCSSAHSSPIYRQQLQPNRQYDGLLMGTKDTVFVSVYQPANTRLTIPLDVRTGTTTNVDFDIYARVGGWPDSTNYLAAGYNSNTSNSIHEAGEFLDVGATTTARTIYLAIVSKVGAGQFSLRANLMKQSTHTSNDHLTICTERTSKAITGSPNYASFIAMLQDASLRLYSMTAGGRWINWFSFKHVNCDAGNEFCTNVSGCDLVMTALDSGVNVCGWRSLGDRSRIPDIDCTDRYDNPSSTGKPIAHELGHSQLDLPDEYETIGGWKDKDMGPFCGHTMMDGPQNSLALCTALNHCRDPEYSVPSKRVYADTLGVCRASDWTRLRSSGDYFFSFDDTETADPAAYVRKNGAAKRQIAVW